MELHEALAIAPDPADDPSEMDQRRYALALMEYALDSLISQKQSSLEPSECSAEFPEVFADEFQKLVEEEREKYSRELIDGIGQDEPQGLLNL